MDPASVNLEHTKTGRRRRRRVGARVVKEKEKNLKLTSHATFFIYSLSLDLD